MIGPTQISPAHRAAYDLGRYRASIQAGTGRLPRSLAAEVMADWTANLGPAEPDGWRAVRNANARSVALLQEFKASHVRAAYDEKQIRDFAENYAMTCAVLIHSADHVPVPNRGTAAGEQWRKLSKALEFAESVGVMIAPPRRATFASMAARLMDSAWWRRQLRKAWTRNAENAMRGLGMIRKGRQPYASNEAVEHRAARAERTRQWMQERVMVNGDGEQLELLRLAKSSVANPAIRRTELMVRARGFDEHAQAAGHEGDFWTLTAPSAFHAYHSHGGINERWQAADRPRVKQAQQWLCKAWARARAKLARISVEVYGIRVAEPHHDGTPHWHMVLYGTRAHLDLARVVIRAVWLSEYAGEPGAAEYRAKVEQIDRSKGSGAGYLAKYIAKNIDGAGTVGEGESDETGELVREACDRVAAWAAVHGIRQFQQYGGPQVGKWRELRRLREPVGADIIEAARDAADRCSWAEFMREADGIELVRETVRDGLVVKPACAVNRYGEMQRPRVVGLRDWCGEVVTRPHQWRIERKCQSTSIGRAAGAGFTTSNQRGGAHGLASSRSHGMRIDSAPRSGAPGLGPVGITVRDAGAPHLGDPASWTAAESSQAGPFNA